MFDRRRIRNGRRDRQSRTRYGDTMCSAAPLEESSPVFFTFICFYLRPYAVPERETPRPGPGRSASRPELDRSDELFELRDDLEQVADETVVGDFEDRGFRILVDRHDGPGVLDPGQVLDRAGDADREVQLRRDDLAGLPHLQFVRHVAGIDRRTRGADGCAHLLGEAVDELEVFRRAQRAAAGDDAIGRLQVRAVAAAIRGGRERGTADRRDDRGVVRDLYGHDRVAGIDRALESAGVDHFLDVGDLVDAEQRRGARHQVLAEGGRRAEHVAVVSGQRSHLRRQPGGRRVLEAVALDRDHATDAVEFRGLAGHDAAGLGKDRDVDRLGIEPERAGQGLGRRRVERAVFVLGNDQDRSHYSSTLFLSSSTSSWTDSSIRPPERFGGGSKAVIRSDGPASTPSSASAISSSGLRLAFMMSGSLTKRGSLRRRSEVSTAGRSTSSVSSPASTSRVTVAVSPSRSTLEAKVAWGRCHRAASIWPVWLQSSSIACLPRKTIFGSSFSTSFSSARAAASGWISSSVTTCSARSAPMARPVRSCCWQSLPPIEQTMTSSALPASLIRRASSSAISSNGLIDIFTPSVSTPEPSDLTRTRTL